MLSGIITPLYNEEIINEYKDVLSRAKFKFTTSLVDNLISVFIDFGMSTVRIQADESYFPDTDDVVFL